jgi:hypothetical protein
MKHRASPKFWRFYDALPTDVRDLADRCFATLKQDTSHPSLNLKKVGRFRAVRIGIHYRAVAIEDAGDLVWFWIGRHDEYERIIGTRP